MDAQLKVKWIEALRSGEYEQGRQYLRHDGNRYCCLGVLCDLQMADFAAIEEQYGTLSLSVSPMQFFGGLSEEQTRKLACFNDEGKSFSEIADYIEKNL